MISKISFRFYVTDPLLRYYLLRCFEEETMPRLDRQHRPPNHMHEKYHDSISMQLLARGLCQLVAASCGLQCTLRKIKIIQVYSTTSDIEWTWFQSCLTLKATCRYQCTAPWYSVDSIKCTVLLNVLSLLSILFSTVVQQLFQKISIKNTVFQEKKSVKS